MTLAIGILGAGGGGAAQFIVTQLVDYEGATFPAHLVATPGAQVLSAALTAYSGVSVPSPSVGGAVGASLVGYGGATFPAPIVAGANDLIAGLTIYGGVTVHSPSLGAGQNVNAGLTAYSGVAFPTATVGGGQSLDASLVAYSGAAILSPSLIGTQVAPLDAWEVFAAETTGTFSVSAGNDRFMVVGIVLEGTGAAIGNPTYGGQALTPIFNTATGNPHGLFYLDEAGIAAAANSNWDVDPTAPANSIVSIAVYENVRQAAPIFASATNENVSGAVADFNLDTLDSGAVVAHAYSGNASVFAWDAALTERTDQSAATLTGSAADLVTTDGSTISVGATASGIAPNRSGIHAAALAPNVAANQSVSAGLTAYSGASIPSPVVSEGLEVSAGLTTYSGVTIQAPTVTAAAADVEVLDAMEVAAFSQADLAGGEPLPFAGGNVSAGTNRALVAIILHRAGTVTLPTGMDLGSEAMTRIDSNVLAEGQDIGVDAWIINDAGIVAAGDQPEIQASGSGGSTTNYRCIVASYENVDQSTPTDDSDADGVTSGSFSSIAALTNEDGGRAIAAWIADGFQGPDADADWTNAVETLEDTGAANAYFSVAEADTSGANISISVTTSGSDLTFRNGLIGFTLKPA